jgi:hypothetical protein
MLPKVNTLYYDLVIPSNGKKIRFRPFLVKEHKALLQAIELGSPDSFVNTICAVIQECVVDEIDLDSLTQYDVDYMFLVIRSKSVGEIVPVRYTCLKMVNKEIDPPEDHDDPTELNENGKIEVYEKCNTVLDLQLDLTNIKVVMSDSYKSKATIKVNEEVGIKLKAPTFKNFREIFNDHKLDKKEKSLLKLEKFETDLLFSSIECIYENDKIMFPQKDFDKKEFVTFIESLPTTALKDINTFFDEVPYVALQTRVKCPICGHEEISEIRDLEDFFV